MITKSLLLQQFFETFLKLCFGEALAPQITPLALISLRIKSLKERAPRQRRRRVGIKFQGAAAYSYARATIDQPFSASGKVDIYRATSSIRPMETRDQEGSP